VNRAELDSKFLLNWFDSSARSFYLLLLVDTYVVVFLAVWGFPL
jgi:hypothetical protein